MFSTSLKYPGKISRIISFSCFIAIGSLNCIYAQDAIPGKNHVVNYKNNVFVFTPVIAPDTTIVEDPITGEQRTVLTTINPRMLTVNGEPVYTTEQNIAGPEANDAENKIKKDIEATLKKSGSGLGKGTYHYYMGNVVINKDGRIIYQEALGLYRVAVYDLDGKEMNSRDISDDLAEELNEKVVKTLEKIKLPPIVVDGAPRNCNINLKGDFTVL